jgi:hypothetical protein
MSPPTSTHPYVDDDAQADMFRKIYMIDGTGER